MKKGVFYLMLILVVPFLLAKELETPLSFTHAPFISPMIIKDLSAWVSDNGDQVVVINLLESQGTNRYFGETKILKPQKQKHPYVFVEGEGKVHFGYVLVGKTTGGVYVLKTSENTGGSGVFENLLLVTFEEDEGLVVDWDKKMIESNRKRLLLKKLGAIPLGDRWIGDLKVEGNKILIGKDKGPSSGKNDHVGGRSLDVPYWLEINSK